uniref:Methyltransferase DDB_G0268948 n=1 Tax=Geotrypetes seraphini TaxID=260995 RepID=A0A6P8QY14_GEOSA|nr:putative methyltransferase DDB_G0268948 [Geotrypetes seraphini]XP_033791441.1 putative methyltransferase DDB_G0268948 [Geotrypetes seraphini]
MADRLFDEKDHSSLYHKYMFPPPEDIQKMIFSYLKEKKCEPFDLAVDVGCGTGNSTQLLAPHFQKVVGVDESEAQLSVAKEVSMKPNISFCVSTAEALPFQDASVDLVTASVAAHWFDVDKFVKEAIRVLKPNGCLAVHCFNDGMELHHKSGPSEMLKEIFHEAWYFLINQNPKRYVCLTAAYPQIFNAIPFPEKQIHTDVPGSCPMSLPEVMGFIESLCTYQYFMRQNPEAAKDFLEKTKERILEATEGLPKEDQFILSKTHVCVLARKSSSNELEG